MKTVAITASKPYNVLIGAKLLDQAGARIRALCPKAEKAALITDDTVDALYAARLTEQLESAGFAVVKFVLPHGEQSKNGQSLLAILNFLADRQLTRSDIVVALGGGMVGDISGFAAACYLRGISYIQVPTTLLADVDSSVGGKTAIDLDAGKNLAGAFYQPELVLCDYETLQTLPADIFTDGCAEVIKYGVLRSEELFEHLEQKGKDFDMAYVLETCVAMKRDFVCQDEFDTGIRRQLNLGHTFGHAVEAHSNFALSHGKAVAIGMATVARASAAAGICSEECAQRIVALLTRFGLPSKTDEPLEELFPHMLSDKKRLGGTVNVIVPQRIGCCRVLPLGIDELKDFMKAGL